MLRPAGPEASGACGSPVGENAVVSITRSNASRSRYGFSSAACADVALAGLIVPASIGAAEASKRARVEFNRDIRPILWENCYTCHGPDKNRRKPKLRLDERASAVGTQAIVPGKPDESELVARVFEEDAEQVMPRPATHKTLTPAQKELLKQWIAQGAEYQAHWAYVSPQRPSIPTVRNTNWVRNPIDAFILSALESPDLRGWSNDHPFAPEIEVESPYLKHRQEQLREQIRQLCSGTLSRATAEPRREAAFEDWAKRIAAFVKVSPTGWTTPTPTIEKGERLQPDGSVLLLDPADKTARTHRGDAWTFRMKPGSLSVARIRLELLPHAAHSGKLARDDAESTSVRLSASVREPSTANEKPLAFFHAEADFREPPYFNGYEVPGVLDGWQTAKDRKSAPQTAIFALDTPVELTPEVELKIVVQTDRAGCIRLSLSPLGFDLLGRPGLDEEERQALAAKPGQRTARQRETLAELYLCATGSSDPAWSAVKPPCLKLAECNDGKTHTMVTKAMPPLVTRVLPRGNWLDQGGPVVEPAVPHFLPRHAGAQDGRLTRLDLARWITAPENPLTARVFMNRLWKHHFGAGISSLVQDVGARGEWPAHPELLDWLALEFRDSGWDVKRMVKLLVMSATYRQVSRHRPGLRDIDPNNRLLAAQSPRRLDAEFVRDNALAVAGLINLDIGGPSVFPYQPAGYYANLQFPDRDYIAETDQRQYRRGVYMHWQRTFLQPMLANFDAPPREECTAARTVANTPQQALTLLNDHTRSEEHTS